MIGKGTCQAFEGYCLTYGTSLLGAILIVGFIDFVKATYFHLTAVKLFPVSERSDEAHCASPILHLLPLGMPRISYPGLVTYLCSNRAAKLTIRRRIQEQQLMHSMVTTSRCDT